jgi:uncharacterized membrane protein YphA (DoxX/SURF4 family)
MRPDIHLKPLLGVFVIVKELVVGLLVVIGFIIIMLQLPITIFIQPATVVSAVCIQRI